MPARLPTQDRAVPVVMAPSKFCPRKLTPHGPNAKRYLSDGPLVGYMLACPACGFVEMHMHERSSFTEQAGKLIAAAYPLRCMTCQRVISVLDGSIVAMTKLRPTV
jgi:hypothetical protein